MLTNIKNEGIFVIGRVKVIKEKLNKVFKKKHECKKKNMMIKLMCKKTCKSVDIINFKKKNNV